MQCIGAGVRRGPAAPPDMDKRPDDRQSHRPEQHPSNADIGGGVAGVEQADPFLKQRIGRYEQKRENAAENDGDEPDGEPGRQRRKIERAGHVAEQSERAEQIKLAQRRGPFAKTGQLVIGSQRETDAERQQRGTSETALNSSMAGTIPASTRMAASKIALRSSLAKLASSEPQVSATAKARRKFPRARHRTASRPARQARARSPV